MTTLQATRVHVLVSAKLLAALRKLSEESGAPVSELVRRAIAEYLTVRE